MPQYHDKKIFAKFERTLGSSCKLRSLSIIMALILDFASGTLHGHTKSWLTVIASLNRVRYGVNKREWDACPDMGYGVTMVGVGSG